MKAISYEKKKIKAHIRMLKLNINHSFIMIFLIQILSKFVTLILLFLLKKNDLQSQKNVV